jgi:hypothetical protein
MSKRRALTEFVDVPDGIAQARESAVFLSVVRISASRDNGCESVCRAAW